MLNNQQLTHLLKSSRVQHATVDSYITLEDYKHKTIRLRASLVDCFYTGQDEAEDQQNKTWEQLLLLLDSAASTGKEKITEK